MRYFLLLGVAAPVLRHLMIYGLAWLTPDYSGTRDYISELGAIDAPYFWPMNVLGIGLIGLMMVPASWALHRCLAPFPGGRAAAWLMGISGVAFVCIALFPCNPGCEADELNIRMIVHLLAGATALGAETFSALVFGVACAFRRRSGARGVLALVLGAVGLGAYLLLFTGVAQLPPGLVQRTVQAAGDLWLFAACVLCLREVAGGNP